MTSHQVCAECRAEQDRWIHMPPQTASRIMRPGIRIATVGVSARSISDANRARVEDFYALVRRQCELIANSCERNHPAP